ncbi:glycosyl hydrolase 53 family protein [Alloscardovia omnicolens]|uniref:glycosyl hydrolase 53 family protein n=1 Tax=Alloscardovia omnicolens TaxID=419015 RepID=UPI003D70C547
MNQLITKHHRHILTNHVSDHAIIITIDTHNNPHPIGTYHLHKNPDTLEFTETSLRKFIDVGVNMGMVQVGNEINGGMASEKSGSGGLLHSA